MQYRTNWFKLSIFFLIIIFCGCAFSLASNFQISADSTITIFRVQIASRASDTAAYAIQQQISSAGVPSVSVQSTLQHGWRVYAGPWATRSEATTTRNLIQSLGYSDALIVTTDISVDSAQAWNLSLTNSLYWQAISSSSSQMGVPSMSQTGGNWLSVYSTGMVTWSMATDTIGWLKAVPYFAQVVQGVSVTTTKANAQFMLGQIYGKLYLHTPKTNGATRILYGQAAIDAMTDLVNQFPQSVNAALAQKKIGDCEHALADYNPLHLQRTATAYQKVITNYSTSSVVASAHLEYAGVIFELAENGMGSWDTVRSELIKVQTLYPSAIRSVKSRASAMQAETYYFQNNFPMMLAGAQTTLSIYTEVVADVALSHYLIGRSYLGMGDYPSAQSKFDYILANFSDISASDPMVGYCRSGALYEKAYCYSITKDTANFQTTINQLLTTYPNSQEAVSVQKYFGISQPTTSTTSTMMVKIPLPASSQILAQAVTQ